MNKSELASKMAESPKLNKKTALMSINATIDAIADALVDGDSVTLIGFGTFSVHERAERQGRNPRTGEPLDIPAKNRVVFKAGKELKDAINN